MATLKQIAIFAKLADTGNMSEAANALALTQPALSQQLRTLETGLGLKLFERVPKGMQLTPAGRDLLSAARNVQNAVRDFDDAADRAAERFVGSIRFGVTPTLGPYLMPSVIKTLHRRYPGLRLYIREGIPDQQHAELAAGELDMVLSPLPIAGRGLAIEPLFREPLRIVVPPDDPLNERPRLAAADFAGRTFLTLDHRHHYHRQLENICRHLDATVLADYEGTSLDAVQQMVGSGWRYCPNSTSAPMQAGSMSSASPNRKDGRNIAAWASPGGPPRPLPNSIPKSVKPSPKKRGSACRVPAPGANRPADRRRRPPRPRPHGGRAWGQDRAGRGRFRRSIRDGARSAANRPQQLRSRSSRCSSPAFPAALHRHRCNSFPRGFRSLHPPHLARPQPILRQRARG